MISLHYSDANNKKCETGKPTTRFFANYFSSLNFFFSYSAKSSDKYLAIKVADVSQISIIKTFKLSYLQN